MTRLCPSHEKRFLTEKAQLSNFALHNISSEVAVAVMQ